MLLDTVAYNHFSYFCAFELADLHSYEDGFCIDLEYDNYYSEEGELLQLFNIDVKCNIFWLHLLISTSRIFIDIFTDKFCAGNFLMM